MRYKSKRDRITTFNKNSTNVIVWDSGAPVNSSGALLGYYCGICEQNGCEALYTIRQNKLFSRGDIPCMCSTRPRYALTSDYIIHLTERMIHDSHQHDIQPVGVIRKGIGSYQYVVILCKHHGIYSRRYSTLKSVGVNCLKCFPSVSGYDTQKKGYLYLLEIQTLHNTILGYGITNKLSDRLATHKRNLASLGATITSTTVYEGSGSAVQAVENSIKALHKTGLLDCEGFRRESLSIERKQEVLELCKDLKLKA